MLPFKNYNANSCTSHDRHLSDQTQNQHECTALCREWKDKNRRELGAWVVVFSPPSVSIIATPKHTVSDLIGALRASIWNSVQHSIAVRAKTANTQQVPSHALRQSTSTQRCTT